MQASVPDAASGRGDAPVDPPQTNTQKNISAVSAIEHEALAARSHGQRLGDLSLDFKGLFFSHTADS